MAESYAQRAMSQRQHIPQHIERAMSQQLQQSMPAHLKKYVSTDKPAYVPRAAEQQIAQYMQKSMPAHMQQYTGAYMQQKIIQPNSANPRLSLERHAPGPMAPLPDKLKLSHSAPNEQHSVQWQRLGENFQRDPAPAVNAQAGEPQTVLSGAQTEAQPPSQPVSPHPPGYEFLSEPARPSGPKFSLPGIGNSGPMRFLVAGGGLLALLIVFMIVKSILSGGGANLDSFVNIAQDQQALIHLTEGVDQQEGISTTNGNFAATAQLTLDSAQSDLLKYLATNHKKVSPKILNLKVSAKLDQRLQAAAQATTYDQTFKEILNTQLTDYANDLRTVYQNNAGAKGRVLLSNQYNQAQLLITQLNSPAVD